MKLGCLFAIAAVVAFVVQARFAMADESYLRKGDVILTIGDSVTAQGVFQEQMQRGSRSSTAARAARARGRG